MKKQTWKAAVSAVTPRRGSLLYNMNKLIAFAAVVARATIPVAANADELVANGSFEEYSGTIGNGGKWEGLGNLTLAGWEHASGSVGLTTASDTSIWKSTARVKGDIVCFFQQNASLSQQINVTEAGTYVVSFRYASRPGYAGYCEGRFYVEIDGSEVGSVDVGSDVSFRTAIMETELSAGGHTLVIRHSKEFCTHSEKLSCSAIDGISITPKTGNLLYNGGFEGYMGVIPSAHWAAASASLNADGWSASGYGLSVAGSPFLKYAKGRPFEGDVALHFNGVQAASQNVEIPESGFYDISFVYAPRNKPDYAGGRVHVWIDDAEAGYVDCPGTTDEFRRFMVRTHIAAGGHVFKLSHTCDNPVSASCIPCSAIDDVSLRAADAILMNGSFDESTIVGVKYADTTSPVFSNPGWSNGGSAGVAAAGSPFVDAAIPVGSYAMYLQTRNYGNGAASPGPAIGWQSFSIAAAGCYGISFSYAKRKDYVDKVAMVRIRRGAGLDGEVVFEDAVTANTPTSFRQYSGTAKLSAAGEYTIEFYVELPEHSTVSNDGAAIIDNVSVDFQRKISGTMIVIK